MNRILDDRVRKINILPQREIWVKSWVHGACVAAILITNGSGSQDISVGAATA